MAPLALEIMRNSLLDIEELFYQMMKSGHEEDILVKIQTAIYLAKLAFEESLKVSSIYEELYADLANHVDTLILKYRNVSSALRNWYDNMSDDNQFHRSIVLRELGNLRGHLELVDSRLKTINVWTDTPRSRFYKKHHCWVDANGFRVRDPKFAVNATQFTSRSPESIVTGIPEFPARSPISASASIVTGIPESRDGTLICPGAPKKSYEKRPDYSVEPVTLIYSDESTPVAPLLFNDEEEEEEEEDQDDEYELSCFKSRGEINRLYEKSLSEALLAENNVVKNTPIRNDFVNSPEYTKFKSDMMAMFGEFNSVNDKLSYSSKTIKLISQCTICIKIYKYLLDHIDFLKNNKTFFENKNAKSNSSFLEVAASRCAVLSRQVEERYDEIRDLVKRVDPSLRRIKNETVALIRQVGSEIVKIRDL